MPRKQKETSATTTTTTTNIIQKPKTNIRKMRGGNNDLKDGDLVILTYPDDKDASKTYKLVHRPIFGKEDTYALRVDDKININSLWIYRRKSYVYNLNKDKEEPRIRARSATAKIKGKSPPFKIKFSEHYNTLQTILEKPLITHCFEVFNNDSEKTKNYLSIESNGIGIHQGFSYSNQDINIKIDNITDDNNNKKYCMRVCKKHLNFDVQKEPCNQGDENINITITPFKSIDDLDDNHIRKLKIYKKENETKLNQYEYQLFCNDYMKSDKVLKLQLLKVDIFSTIDNSLDSSKKRAYYNYINTEKSSKNNQFVYYKYLLYYNPTIEQNIMNIRDNNTDCLKQNDKCFNNFDNKKNNILMNVPFMICMKNDNNNLLLESLHDTILKYLKEEKRVLDESINKMVYRIYNLIPFEISEYDILFNDKYFLFDIDTNYNIYIEKNNIKYYLCLLENKLCFSDATDNTENRFVIHKISDNTRSYMQRGRGRNSHQLLQNVSSIDINLCLKEDNTIKPNKLMPLINEYLIQNDLLCSCTI